MRKNLLMVFGLASTLALAVAFAADKATEPAKEAQTAAIQVEGKAYDCQKAESQCLRKKSGAAKAQSTDDQNMASSGFDCPKSADCPRADCDKSMCLKPQGKAKTQSMGKAEDKSGAETEI